MEKVVHLLCKKNSEKRPKSSNTNHFWLCIHYCSTIEPKYFGMPLNQNFGVDRNSKINRNLGLGFCSEQ